MSFIVIDDKNILNNAWRFLKDKKEQDEKIFYNYYFEQECDDIDDCCKDAIDKDYNYCPDCGTDVSCMNYKLPIFNSCEEYPNKRFSSKKEFKEFFIKENNYNDEFFYDVDVSEELKIDKDLYYTIKRYLQDTKE